jgi:hypothetical protein
LFGSLALDASKQKQGLSHGTYYIGMVSKMWKISRIFG